MFGHPRRILPKSMKQCPECNRIYTDDTLNFCLDDGTALVYGPRTSEPVTEILPPNSPGEAPTRRQLTDTDKPASHGTTAKNAVPGPWSIRRNLRFLLPLLLIVPVGYLGYRYLYAGPGKQIESVAVLPFVNESGNPDIEYLSDGMAESLINSLSQLPALNVKARSLVFRYKGREADAQAVGKDLGVQAILNGRLVQRGDGITLYLELVDTLTGNRLWGDRYDRKTSELISLQSEIARDVAQKVVAKLSRADELRVARNYTTNVEAYQLYLKGRFHLFKLTPAGIQTGISYFQQAIDIDPSYALAYVGLANAYRALALSTDSLPAEVFPKSKAAAQKAVALDDNLAEAHAVLGFTIFWYDWNWREAEKEFKRAIELNPNNADGYWAYATLLSVTGRHDEGLAKIRRARELDPLAPMVNATEGLILINAGRTDEAILSLRKSIEILPNFWLARLFLSSALCEKGLYSEAVTEAQTARDLSGISTQPISYVAYALAKDGRRTEAEAALQNLLATSKERYVPPYHIALAYAGLGDREQALSWLRRGIEQRDPKMVFLKVEPMLSGLRSDPQYLEILKQVDLAD